MAQARADLAAVQRRVVNVIGHELRTPMTMIHGLAGELEAVDSLATVHEVVAPALLRQTSRLTRLLDDLLVAAGIDTAIPVDEPGSLVVPVVLEEIWGELTGRALAVDGVSAEVAGPLSGFRKAFTAVLENAMQYGVDDPVVHVEEAEDHLSVAVVSPGRPIHAEEARLATQPFYRGEAAVTTRPGLGMGLTIAATVLGHIGGSIELLATEDGTTTILRIPRGDRS